jgi:hypothetical protein
MFAPPRFKEMRLRMYHEFVERAAHKLPDVIIHLPDVLAGVVCEYWVPDEFEHFMLIFGTNLVLGDIVDDATRTITTKILGDHIVFSRFGIQIPSEYAVSNFDSDGFKNRIRLGMKNCKDSYQVSQRWKLAEMDRQSEYIARSMYWRFKDAAQHLAKELL